MGFLAAVFHWILVESTTTRYSRTYIEIRYLYRTIPNLISTPAFTSFSMAPPAPVYNKLEIRSRYDEQLNDPEKYHCQLREITQHECTFRVAPDRKLAPEIICLPFKRVFQRCLFPYVANDNGKKVRGEKWVNIEVTTAETNSDLMARPRYGKDVQDFLGAEKELKKLMAEEADI